MKNQPRTSINKFSILPSKASGEKGDPDRSWVYRIAAWGLVGINIFFAVQLAFGIQHLFAQSTTGRTGVVESRFVAALSGGGDWVLDDGEFIFGLGDVVQAVSAADVKSQTARRREASGSQTENNLMNSFLQWEHHAGDPFVTTIQRKPSTANAETSIVLSAAIPKRQADGESRQDRNEATTTVATIQRSSGNSIPAFAKHLFGLSQRMARRVRNGQTTGWACVASMSQAEILKSIDQSGTPAKRMQSDDGCAVYVIQVADETWFLMLGPSDEAQQFLMILQAP